MIYKRGRYYWAKFHFKGRVIRESREFTNAKDARFVEGKIRAELARGNWDILEKKAAPIVADFLKKDFRPFIETSFAKKSKILDYYLFGIKMILKSGLLG